MSYTKYGEYMRILRIKNHEVMGDTAKFLNVRIPFVSAVENGKRNIPEEWYEKIVNHYNLTTDEQAELKEAITESKTQMKVNLMNSNNVKRKMALQFQRSFEDIDDETAKRIIDILNSNGGGTNGL